MLSSVWACVARGMFTIALGMAVARGMCKIGLSRSTWLARVPGAHRDVAPFEVAVGLVTAIGVDVAVATKTSHGVVVPGKWRVPSDPARHEWGHYVTNGANTSRIGPKRHDKANTS
jgi:hypothetical protein